MARYRKLYTKTVESLDVHDMPDDFTRLFWVLLPLVVCREGRGLDRPAWLRSKVFPLRDDVTISMIEEAMAFFESRNMVQRYQDNSGRSYFQLTNWARYQGDTSREAESPYPAESAVLTSGSSVTRERRTTAARNAHNKRTTSACPDANADSEADTEASEKVRRQ